MKCTVGGGEGRGQRRPTRDATEPRPGSATRPVLMLCRGLTDTGAQEENRAASPLSGSDKAAAGMLMTFLSEPLSSGHLQPARSPGPCWLRPGQRSFSSPWLLPHKPNRKEWILPPGLRIRELDAWMFLAHGVWSFQI